MLVTNNLQFSSDFFLNFRTAVHVLLTQNVVIVFTHQMVVMMSLPQMLVVFKSAQMMTILPRFLKAIRVLQPEPPLAWVPWVPMNPSNFKQ